MCLLDMSPEISFEAGGEATLITVELDVLVPRLDMLLQLVGDGGPVAAVRAGEALSVLGDHVPPEDLGRTALVAALVTVILYPEMLAFDVIIEQLVGGGGVVTVVTQLILLENLLRLLIRLEVHPLDVSMQTALIDSVEVTLITVVLLHLHSYVVLLSLVDLQVFRSAAEVTEMTGVALDLDLDSFVYHLLVRPQTVGILGHMITEVTGEPGHTVGVLLVPHQSLSAVHSEGALITLQQSGVIVHLLRVTVLLVLGERLPGGERLLAVLTLGLPALVLLHHVLPQHVDVVHRDLTEEARVLAVSSVNVNSDKEKELYRDCTRIGEEYLPDGVLPLGPVVTRQAQEPAALLGVVLVLQYPGPVLRAVEGPPVGDQGLVVRPDKVTVVTAEPHLHHLLGLLEVALLEPHLGMMVLHVLPQAVVPEPLQVAVGAFILGPHLRPPA